MAGLMSLLKLLALEPADLEILSAHTQDAVARVGDAEWLPKEKRFVLALNRFVWEKGKGKPERRRSVLVFSRVEKVRSHHVSRADGEAVISLLAMTFEPGEAPSGEVALILSGGGEIRLGVECLEVSLTDLGGAWETASRPAHAD